MRLDELGHGEWDRAVHEVGDRDWHWLGNVHDLGDCDLEGHWTVHHYCLLHIAFHHALHHMGLERNRGEVLEVRDGG